LLAAVMVHDFLATNAVRWWVIHTLGEHWNVQIVDSTAIGRNCYWTFPLRSQSKLCSGLCRDAGSAVDTTAWITALVGSIAHVVVLAQRLSTEERRIVCRSRLPLSHGGQTKISAAVLDRY